MTEFYLVRHGQADWGWTASQGLTGFRTDFTPLTKRGVAQIEQTAHDPRLAQASLIVSSPYTRALQSAAILTRKLGLALELQYDLREWVPDRLGQTKNLEQVFAAARDFEACHGHPPDDTHRWESHSSLRSRALNALKPYTGFERVIVCTHEMLIWSLTGQRDVQNGEVVEFVLG